MALPSRTFGVLLVALFVGTSAVHGLYEKDGSVALLSQRTFSKVLESQVPVVVEFFAPWCGHCKSLAPAFTKAAAKLQGIVPFVAVDCDADKNRGLCGQFGVQGFPTIKLFSSGKAAPKDYQGERSAKALVDAATGMLTAKHVKRVGSDADAEAFLEKHSGSPRVVLFSDKAQPSPLYKSLATRFQPKLAFAEVGTGAKDTASRFGVTSRPTLVVVGVDGQPQTYQGELKAPSLIDFLKKLADPGGAKPDGEAGSDERKESPKKEGKGSTSKQQQQQGEGEGESKDKDSADGKDSRVAALPHVVKNVTLAELEGQVLGKEGVGVLAFYAGEEAACAPVLTQLNQAVHGLSGLAQAAQVHLATPDDVAAAAKQLAPLDAAALAAAEGKCPMQVFLLPFDEKEDSDEWKKFDGELSAKELQKPLMQLFPATFVSGLTGQGAEAFVMDDPGRVKVLLFSDKADVPPLFRALAVNFRQYRMDFAMASASDQVLMRQFNVPKVPHVLVLAVRQEEGAPTPDADGKGKGKGKQLPIAMQPYEGPLRYPHLSTFLKIAAFQLGAAPQEVIDELLAASGQKAPAAAAAAAVTVPQLCSQAEFQEACLDKGGVCILALLPPQPAEQAQQAQQAEQGGGAESPPASSPELTTLRHVAHQRALAAGDAMLPLHFAWVDAAKFKAFARALGVAEPGEAAAVVALAPKKRRYAVMGGPLLPDVLDRFVSGLLSGQVTTAPLQDIPELVEQQGEEEAAAEEPVEEEFDLADIMKEEVAGDVGHTAQERIAAAEAAEAERLKQQAAKEAEAAAAAAKEGGGKKKGSKKKVGKKKKKAAASKDEL